MKALKKVLKDKENEISKSKKQLYRVKEDAIKEYRDFDAFLAKLGDSFANGFDDCLHQVKASFLDLDLSQITIDVEGQILAHPVDSEGTDELFVDDINLDLKVMRRLLMLIKKNLLRTVPINLKGIRQLRRRMKRPLPFSNSFLLFLFTCTLLTFDHLRK